MGSVSWSELAGIASLGAWGISFIATVLKGRDLVEKIALNALKSAEGREAVLSITGEKHDRIEEKLDTLAKTVDSLATRLEGRIDQMGAKLEARLEKLDASAHEMDLRLTRVEERKKPAKKG